MPTNCKYNIEDFVKELGLPLFEAADLYLELASEIECAVSDLKSSITTHDIKSQKRIIHNIKGLTGNYRISDIHALSSEINTLFKSGDFEQALSLFPAFFCICEAAVSEIKTYFSSRSY